MAFTPPSSSFVTKRGGHSHSPTATKSPSSLLSLHATSAATPTPTTTRLVWLTGHEDLRLHDHGGFSGALSFDDCLVVPVFVLDPNIHLRSKSQSALMRLHKCLSSLESALETASPSSILSPLIVRSGSASDILPSLAKEINAISCHVVANDVLSQMRNSQRLTCQLLEEMGSVQVERWTNALRPSAPWATTKNNMPSFFPEYCKIVDDIPIPSPEKNYHHDSTMTSDDFDNAAADNNNSRNTLMQIHSEGVPSITKLFDMATSVTPPAVTAFSTTLRSANTAEPYEEKVTNEWATEKKARQALEEYCHIGKDSFADKHFGISSSEEDSRTKSLYAAAAYRMIQVASPSEVLALREAPTRAFSLALSMGSLSARDVIDAARNRCSSYSGSNDDNSNRAGLYPSDDPLWGRSSEGSLSDVIEWREYHRLLADRSLKLQEGSEPGATSGSEKIQSGDPREAGTPQYWRWKDQHLVRYLTWPAGKDYDAKKDGAHPAILLVHGFAASAEQWERLVYSLREQNDAMPPIFALDLLGFGHSEKPGLSYTQYLWESQIVDFAVEVMEAKPLVMVGNSIGGGLSAGAAASLGKKICKGLVLCNTAGILEDPETYTGYTSEKKEDGSSKFGGANSFNSHTDAAFEGNPNEAPYSPVPVVGRNALDLFGKGIIQLIYPQIDKRLSLIYGNKLENADAAAVYAIQQSAMHPGSANVIGSGQKLAPNRPLNEVLVDAIDDKDESGCNVLVIMGLDDRVSSPQVAQSRAELFSKFNPDQVTVDAIADAGHCPHDEKPNLVASSLLKWLDKISKMGR